ncbi:MAG: hypothetical protein J6Z00_03310, partial [Clostridia bacterium]|nr:hypothetical protein [Clostridia bacterium]
KRFCSIFLSMTLLVASFATFAAPASATDPDPIVGDCNGDLEIDMKDDKIDAILKIGSGLFYILLFIVGLPLILMHNIANIGRGKYKNKHIL